MDIKSDLMERFLRYVKIDTRSKDGQEDRYPSTDGQLDLLRMLTDELKQLELENVKMDEHGYVTAVLPQNVPTGVPAAKELPVVGLLAHVDTYHEVSGRDVKPILHENYDGGTIELPGAPGVVINPKDNPDLLKHKGDTIITSNGTTLLGADDKAGVAEIMTLLSWYRSDPSLPHPEIHVAFTPDEEVGRGTDYFDVEAFGADLAYTLDGSGVGEVEDETFCADTAIVTIKGVDVHPGYAKGKMVNAVRIAADFISRFPADALPETTEGYEDYLHPFQIQGSVTEAKITCLVRSFTEEGLKKMEQILEKLSKEIQEAEPRAEIKVDVSESYRNMKQVLDKNPKVVEYAEEAMRRVGIEPVRLAIRGGTDGARLSFQGLPTPNLSAGGYNFHAVTEWVPVQAMVKAVEVTDALMKIWVERGKP